MHYQLNTSIVHLKDALSLSGIYCIRNLSNDKCYIGSSKNVFNRVRCHISQLNNNSHANNLLQRDWNEYGATDFIIEILEEVEGRHKDRLKIEAKWILELEGYPYGYNLNVSTHGYRTRKHENQYYPKYHRNELTPEIAAKRFQNGDGVYKIARDYGCNSDYVNEMIISYVRSNNLTHLYGG